MQLAQAIDAWLDVHGERFSVSTRRDIERISVAVIDSGWGDLPHEEVDLDVREDIIEEATQSGTLRGSSISEFFNVVLAWADTQEQSPDIDGLGPTGVFLDEGDDDSESDDESYDNDDNDSDDDSESDDESYDNDDESYDNDDEPDDDESDDDEPDDDNESESYDNDDEPDDDNESESYDNDDEPDDDNESESYDNDDEPDDDDELAEPVDPDDWVGYLGTAQDGDDFTGLSPENEPSLPIEDDDPDVSDHPDVSDDEAPVDEKAAASSFLKAIESSPAPDDDPEPVVVIESETIEAKGGVFSAAAEQVPAKPESGIDWITVAYFAVAAVCFALVIYFYWSSN